MLTEPGERADALRVARPRRASRRATTAARAPRTRRRCRRARAATTAALAAHLRAEQLVVAALDPAERPDEEAIEAILRHDRVGATPAGRALLATLAVHELYAGAPRERVLALADRALAGGALLEDEGARETSVYGDRRRALHLRGARPRGRAAHRPRRQRARERGNVMALASASYSRSWARLIAGRVTDAVDDAQQAVDAGATAGGCSSPARTAR